MLGLYPGELTIESISPVFGSIAIMLHIYFLKVNHHISEDQCQELVLYFLLDIARVINPLL